MAAMLMTALFIVALTEFSVAGLTIERRKTQNAVDAVALELGDEMILKKNTDWPNFSSAVNYFLTNNGQDGSQGFASPTIAAPTWDYGFAYDPASASNPSIRDSWIPATVQVRASIAPITYFQKTLQLVSNILPGGTTNVQTQYNVDAKARVPQVQLSSFTVSRARAMLLFDFSPSMRLQYANTPPDNWQYSGLYTVKYVASQMMLYMHQQYNFSVRVFGYQNFTLSESLKYSTQLTEQPNWAYATSYNADSYAKLMAQDSLETSTLSATDMVSSIRSAVTELEANNDYLAGAPIFILVSDGEPDKAPGMPCPLQILSQCNALAAAVTKQEMINTWAISDLKGMGIESFTYLINRDNNNLQEQDVAFMQSIAGDQNNQPRASNFMLDEVALDTSYMTNFMLNLPIKDYCMSGDISTFSVGKPADMAYPRANEPISGYFTLGGDVDPANQDMYQAMQAMSFAELFAELPQYPKIAPLGLDPLSPDNTITPLKSVLNQPASGLARFYYDPISRRVWLNP
jgi:hypothetical protein